jgi:glyoxylase-like metal-dependent hydrolase (beta-lactamase superfamily II)
MNEIEQSFEEWGFKKLTPQTLQKVSDKIAEKYAGTQYTSGIENDEISNLAAYYIEQKYQQFLETGFRRLSSEDQVKWLKQLAANSGLESLKADLPRILVGGVNFAALAMIKIYADSDARVREYIDSALGKFIQPSLAEADASLSIPAFLLEFAQREKTPQPYLIKREALKATATTLTSFFFNLGGNIYAFSYQKMGIIKHTLIDTGERRHKLRILNLLRTNGIEPANIETILLTHHHMDHSGLIDIICLASGATVLVHPKFEENTVEIDLPQIGRYLKRLPAEQINVSRNIGDVVFPVLGELLDIGEGAKLEILGLPEQGGLTHSVDQLVFFYTPYNSPETRRKIGLNFRPADEYLFSGDLWLMHPPGFIDGSMRNSRVDAIMRKNRLKIDHRPQNRQEKDTLKKGFKLVTVKPGHGPEFLGARILGSVLSERDILVKLGFDEKEDKKLLQNPQYALAIRREREQSLRDFCQELQLWLTPVKNESSGYRIEEAVDILKRIYAEQKGGGDLVGQDRIERKRDLKNKMALILKDSQAPEELKLIGRSAISELEKMD